MDIIFSDISMYQNKLLYNEDAIFQSVLNFLNIKKNERFFKPYFYMDLENLVFKLKTKTDFEYLRILILSRLKIVEKRITNIEISLVEDYGENNLLINIKLSTVIGEINKNVVFNKGRSA